MAFKYVAGGAALVIAGSIGYAAWSVQAKRAEHRAITAVVGEASGGLAAALKRPDPAQAARLQAAAASLQSLSTSRQRAYAEAADVYLVSARAIAQRQADIARLEKAAVEARQAFVAHMRGPRGRDGQWMRQATDLQKRMDQAHHELQRVQEALVQLLYTLPEAEKPLVPFAGASVLTDSAVYEAALKRAEEHLKRSAQDADAARRLR
jgi:cytochrome c556